MYSDRPYAFDPGATETPKKKRRVPRPIKLGIILIVLILVASTFFSMINIVPEGHVGAKYRLGALVTTELDPGLNFAVPFVESIKNVDVKEKTFELNMTAYTKDTQVVENIKIKLNYIYDLAMLPQIIQSIGLDNVEARLLVPNTTSVTKNMAGKYKAEELIQNRSLLQESVEEELRELLYENGIVVISINIEDIDFEDSFEENIRKKVEAEIAAQTKKNETATKEEEARQEIIAANADAESARIAADAEAYGIKVVQEQLAQSPQYIEYQKVNKWNGRFPEVMGNTVNPFVAIN